MSISTSSTGWKKSWTAVDDSALSQQPRNGHQFLRCVLRLIVAAAIVYLVFYKHGAELLENLQLVGLRGLLLLILMAAVYQALDAAACMQLIRRRIPNFRFWQSLELMELGFFFQITTMSVGSIPAQGIYLRHCGLMMGDGLGLIAMNYVIHKTAVLLVAMLLMAVSWQRFSMEQAALRGLLLTGAIVSVLLIGGLLLLCTWEPMYRLVCRVLSLLPATEKWQKRKDCLLQNLDALQAESQETWRHPRHAVCALAIHVIKHLWTALIPVVCLYLLQIDVPPMQTMLLTSLCLMISGAVPNVAGMGPAEFSFLLLFAACLEPAQAASALVLFRCATYFLPFLASIPVSKKAVSRAQCQRKRLNAYEETKKERP